MLQELRVGEQRLRAVWELLDWTAPRFPDGWIVLFHAAACWFKYSVRTSCGVR
jgi:hypothetical protein